ncbi:MAG: hypothetical protein A3B47_03370 [Candidatus Levybacteria bacterium RIFCSPLOWO2_01_FULL_39_24]|nr:MAG: hypothetical protein A2800_02660 [Candidatus Levybacteria bacterium RIFCSPHIGHO2_01_FULL_40_16]OGH28225.1 MAG: hypothetical protein A3E12_00630 [Candidatus Levybacteria bacterium RIFCSPHIGHO2_12_FULL_39_9]OGH46660.1 MAG: hypothetical protein A3B47_03370 [Candidatus Levybacteria bacterium RIFCSPLOWO2_01_FULL_39_24]
MNRIEHDQPVITLTNPVPTEGGKFNGKVTNDAYTETRVPSSSLAAIDGVLKGAGFTKVSTEDSRFYPKYGNSTPDDIKRIFQSDIVGISGTNRNADSSLDFTHEYKKQKPDGVIIAGGFGPSMETEKWLLGGVDIVVRGEGDITASLVVNAIKNGDSLENIKGISYLRDGKIINNEDNPLLTEKELSEVPLPFYPDYIKRKRRLHTVNESRGCYGKCKFCCVTVAYGGTYRMKTPERVATEIADSRNGEPVFFTGDNLAPRSRRADSRRLADTLINRKLVRPYLAQIDASFAEDLDFVRLWKKAGLFWVFKGQESTNTLSLNNVGKAFTAEQGINATNILRKEGFGVHDMFILGIDGDTPETIKMLKDYFRKRNKANTGQLFLLTPLIGTQVGREKPIFDFAKNESNLFDGQHLVTYPPPEFTCVGLQDTAVGLYLDLFNSKHLLNTILTDSKQFLLDRERGKKLLAFDIASHIYARKTVASMKKDPYYQDFRENLRREDEAKTAGKVIFDAKTHNKIEL